MKKSSRRSKAPEPVVPATDPGRLTRTLNSLRKWATGWIVSIIIIPIALQLWMNHRNRAQLSISVAKGLVGSIRTIRPDGVYEHRAVLDLHGRCVTSLFEYIGRDEIDLPPPATPRVPRLVYGLYLENIGRSEITDIRLTFRSRLGRFEIAASPQLSLDQTEQLDPEGQTVRTATVASLAPGAKGVIVGTLPVADVQLTVEQQDNGLPKVIYTPSPSDPNLVRDRHVRFTAARQLSEAPLKSIPLDELYRRLRDAFELEALPVPFDPVEMSGFKGSAFEMAGPFSTCPGVGCECYHVPIAQLTLTPEQLALTEEERAAIDNRPERPHKHRPPS